MFDYLFSADDFMDRGHCGVWSQTLILWYIGANTLIALSYFVIPIHLAVIARARKISDTVPTKILVLFALFIFACGVGHIVDGILPFIWPNYRLIAVWHTVTAILSATTAVVLPPIIAERMLKK